MFCSKSVSHLKFLSLSWNGYGLLSCLDLNNLSAETVLPTSDTGAADYPGFLSVTWFNQWLPHTGDKVKVVHE